MKISTFENCIATYNEFNGWEPEFDRERNQILRVSPFSVIVEGDYLEYEMVVDWCSKMIGLQNIDWKNLCYQKIDYDYCFWEFFFAQEDQARQLQKFVPLVYADARANGGKKWRSDGYDKSVYLS